MADPQIHGNRMPFSALSALQAIGSALTRIKSEDGLTWADMGVVVGKSDDQAARYADGSSTMDVIAFARAKREWNGRFTGPFDRLCADSRPVRLDDNIIHSQVIRASLSIAEAKENGGQIFDWEIRCARPVLEQARDAIEDLLRRIPDA